MTLDTQCESVNRTVPVAIFVFNRPEKAARCLARIREYRPRKLYVIADGPRSDVPLDAGLCEQSRQIVSLVDWECEIVTDFAAHNLGVMERVTSGITAVFEREEYAIILEDDCLVDRSFFSFAETLLERYKEDNRVMCINAPNYQKGTRRSDGDYFFTKYALTWGWATWRRAWNRFEPDFRSWPSFRRDRLCEMFRSVEERLYWNAIYEREMARVGTRAANWDYAWLLSCWANDGACICPQVNLSVNIGDGPDATHTTASFEWQPAVGRLRGVRPPTSCEVDEAADLATFRNWYGRRQGALSWLRRYVGITRAASRALLRSDSRSLVLRRR